MPRQGFTCIIVIFSFVACSISLQAQFVLNGSAIQLDENCYRLTPAANWMKGSIWYYETVDLNEDFEVIGQIFLGCSDAGADGIAFALQPLGSDIGESGGGIGIEGVEPSLIIEFDTWQNTDRNDPVFDHAAILRDGVLNHNAATNLAGPVGIAPGGPNVEDCEYHHLRITWNASDERLSYYWDCQLRLSWAGDVIDDIFGGNPEVYWGFTSATGAANNEHKMCFNHVSFIDTTDHKEICLGEEVQLNAPDGTSFQWTPATGLSNPNIQNPVASPEVTTTYTVEISDDCGLSYDYEVLVEVHQPLPFSLGNDMDLCEGETFILDPGLPPGGTFEWQDGSSGPTYTVTDEGTYELTYTVAGGCPYTDDIFVDFHEPYEETFTEVICEGETIHFGGEVYDETGFYTVYNQTVYGCDSISNLNLAVVPNPVVNIDGPTAICASEPDVGLSVPEEPSYSSYLWNTGETTPIILIESGGLYSVTVTSIHGCTGEDLIYVNEAGATADTLDRQICEGDSVIFNGSVYYQSGTYSDTLNTEEGCDSIIVLHLSVQNSLQPGIAGDTTICRGGSGSLHTTATFDTYNWSTGDTTRFIDIYSHGLYAVTVTSDGGCSGTDSLVVTTLPPETDTIERQICSGQSLVFGGDTLTQSGWFTDSLSVASGCDSIVTLHLMVGEYLNISISGTNSICPSDTSQLQAPEDFLEYRWNTGDSSRTIKVTAAGLYAVTVTDSTGCSGRDSITVSEVDRVTDSVRVSICAGGGYLFGGDTLMQSGLYADTLRTSTGCDSIIILDLTVSDSVDVGIGGNTELCPSETGSLQVPAEFTEYSWSTGENTALITVSREDWYSVTVTDTSGCSGVDSVFVSVRMVLSDTSHQSICAGDSYIWNGMPLVNAGLYTDTLPSVNGCDSIAALQLGLIDNPQAEILGDSIFCTGRPATLEASPAGLNYSWSTGQNGISQEVSSEGWYALTVTDPSGCRGVDSMYVSSTSFLRDTVRAEVCEGETFQFGGLSYSQSGTYGDTLTASSGCDSIAILVLTVHSIPRFSISGDTTICESGLAELVAPSGYEFYSWSTGENAPVITVDAPGSYSITVTDGSGCPGEATVQVSRIKLHPVITSDDPLCPGDDNGSISVSEINGGLAPYQITIAGQSLEIGEAVGGLAGGEYSISFTDRSGCSFDTLVRLTDPQIWTLEIGDELDVEIGESINITAATSLDSIASYTWNSYDSAYSISPTVLGLQPTVDQWVSLQLTDRNGCMQTDSVFLRVNSNFRVYFPNAFSPNGDGINDYWKPYWTEDVIEYLRFTIFNRWGDKVYDCEGLNCRWDGYFKGQKFNPGVFAFIAEYSPVASEEVFLIHGEIILVD